MILMLFIVVINLEIFCCYIVKIKYIERVIFIIRVVLRNVFLKIVKF